MRFLEILSGFTCLVAGAYHFMWGNEPMAGFALWWVGYLLVWGKSD